MAFCMMTWHIVDDNVESLHVEKNLHMTCSRFHLYSCTSLRLKKLVILGIKICQKGMSFYLIWYVCMRIWAYNN
jgi:hypothetical protein